MVDLKKSSQGKDSDIIQAPTRTAYPEYESFIAEEIMPQSAAWEKPFKPLAPENETPVRVQTAEPFGAALPAKKVSLPKQPAAQAAVQSSPYVLTASEAQLIKDYCDREKEKISDHAAPEIAAFFLIAVAIPLFPLLLSSGLLFLVIIVVASLILGLRNQRNLKENFFENFKKSLNFRHNYGITIEKVKGLYHGRTVGFEDGTRGLCLNEKDYDSLQIDDEVRLVRVYLKNVAGTPPKEINSCFVFKL